MEQKKVNKEEMIKNNYLYLLKILNLEDDDFEDWLEVHQME